MNWLITIKKGLLGAATFVGAYLVANPGVITNLIPENILTMTIGGAIAGLIIAATNWLKHRNQ